MKKTMDNVTLIIRIIIDILIAMCLFVNALLIIDNRESREVKAQVVAVDNDVITIEDTTGNLWQFEGTGYFIDEIIYVRFDTLGTDTIYDDVIIQVRGA
ncbi:MAG: hypothetical protein ACI4XN_03090 [Candidatus Kurthia intestinigallinarum]